MCDVWKLKYTQSHILQLTSHLVNATEWYLNCSYFAGHTVLCLNFSCFLLFFKWLISFMKIKLYVFTCSFKINRNPILYRCKIQPYCIQEMLRRSNFLLKLDFTKILITSLILSAFSTSYFFHFWNWFVLWKKGTHFCTIIK